MENTPNTPPPAPQTQTPPPVEESPATPAKIPLQARLKKLLNFDSLNLTPKNKKFLKIGIAILVVFMVFTVAAAIIMRFMGSGKSTTTPSPTPTPISGEGVVKNPSPYANDPEVAAIEMQIEELDKKLKATKLKEEDLQPPQLDWNISF